MTARRTTDRILALVFIALAAVAGLLLMAANTDHPCYFDPIAERMVCDD